MINLPDTDIINIIKKTNTIDKLLVDKIIVYNKINVFKYIIENKIINIDYLNIEGKTILYNIIKYDKKELLDIVLEYNKNIIGLNIKDILDINNNNSIVYTIYYNNYEMFLKLYEYGFSIYNTNTFGKNCFYIAVEQKKYKILEYMINNNNNFIFYNNLNENFIYFLLIKQEYKYINMLLDKKDLLFEFNSMENNYGLNILIIILLNNKLDLFKRLSDFDINYNNTDFAGNSILHYAVLENNIDFIIEISKLKNINYNIQNINGKTFMHLLCENIELFDKLLELNIIKEMMEHINLNLQDELSESILFAIVKNKRLDNIITYIKEKNINPLLKNIYNNDILDINTNDKLIDILVDQYFRKLNNIDVKNLSNKYDIFCKKGEFKNLDNIKEYKMLLKDTDNDKKCKKIILYNLNKKIRYKPLKKTTKITFDTGIFMDGCFYTGSTIDIIYGLIYIKSKYSNCSILLEEPLTKNDEIEQLYTKLNIDYPYRLDFCNFHILWVTPSIIYPTYFNNIIKLKKKYIIIPITIALDNFSHANIIFIDKNKKTIERFEPHGKLGNTSIYYNGKLLDRNLINKFKILFPDFTYYSPDDFLETVSFQTIENNMFDNCKLIGDPNGFCAIWCTWWVEQRLKYSYYDMKSLALKLIQKLKEYNVNFKDMIRKYSTNISLLRDQELKKVNIDINDWLNSNYDNNLLIELEKNIINQNY